MADSKGLLAKYGDIIKEEINVKDIASLDASVKITKIFKPLGNKLSSKYAKDTGKIIQFGKQGNIKPGDNDSIIIFDPDASGENEWKLEKEDYEIAYEGLEGDNIAVDGSIIAKLDLEMTPALINEGIAREISRFLNQMRKDADYTVDTKVTLLYETSNKELEDILLEFKEFFKHEALVKAIEKNADPQGDIRAQFLNGESYITFALQK
jgi:isoleucyl-tRNA synthetase